MKSQLNNALLELKSLQTVIELLQRDREQNNDLTLMNFQSSLKEELWVTVYEAENVNCIVL